MTSAVEKAAPEMSGDLDLLWEPIEVGAMTVPNRVMVSAHDLLLEGARYAAYLGARARGGAGLLVTGALRVTEAGLRDDVRDSGTSRPRAWEADSLPWFDAVARAVHAHHAKVIAQLLHPGAMARGNMSLTEWSPPLSASDVAHPLVGVQPKPMDQDDIDALVEGFAVCAAHAREGGMDGVEIHGAHGYLLHQFLSPLFNRRTDSYGGGSENRARLVLEVGRAIRRRVGEDFVLGLKLSLQEHLGAAGLGGEASIELVRVLRDSGLFDYFSITGVYHTAPMLALPMTAEAEPGTYASDSAMVKREVGPRMPVMVTGSVRTLRDAADIVRRGDADVVGMVRAHLADPDLVRKTRSGRGDEVRRCVGANQGCWSRTTVGSVVTCTVNPASGREVDGWDSDTVPPIDGDVRVVIVGGGPAGMQAAETAAKRGCRVTLIEQTEFLGGALRFAARLPRRQRWNDLVEDLTRALARCEVEVRFGTEATPQLVGDLDPDHVILATGASWDKSGRSMFRPGRSGIPGIATTQVMDPIDAVTKLDQLGRRVLVVDDTGRYIPLGLADLISESGRSVDVVTMLPSPGAQTTVIGTNDLAFVYPALVGRGVRFWNQMAVDRISGRSVTLSGAFGAPRHTLTVDSVVLSTTRTSRTGLFEALAGTRSGVVRVGDCISPRGVDDAVFEGKRAALAIRADALPSAAGRPRT